MEISSGKLGLMGLLLGVACPRASPSNVTHSCELSLSLWKVYTDTAVFDWYITMENKARMERCDLTYGEEGKSNSTKVMENFLPIHRSFNLHPLRQNTTYWVTMVCTDNQAALHSSPTLTFTTNISRPDEPKVGAQYSHRIQDGSQDGGQGGRVAVPEIAPTDFRSKLILSIKPRDKISPHTILGAGCGLVGLVIMVVTSGLVLRKYSRFRTEQDRIWEESNRREMEECVAGLELDTISFYCQHKDISHHHHHVSCELKDSMNEEQEEQPNNTADLIGLQM